MTGRTATAAITWCHCWISECSNWTQHCAEEVASGSPTSTNRAIGRRSNKAGIQQALPAEAAHLKATVLSPRRPSKTKRPEGGQNPLQQQQDADVG